MGWVGEGPGKRRAPPPLPPHPPSALPRQHYEHTLVYGKKKAPYFVWLVFYGYHCTGTQYVSTVRVILYLFSQHSVGIVHKLRIAKQVTFLTPLERFPLCLMYRA